VCTEYHFTGNHGKEYRLSVQSSGDDYRFVVVLGESITQLSTGVESWLIGNYLSVSGGTQLYNNGDSCGNGITREATITLLAGKETKLLEVKEPSPCKYAFLMETNCKEGNILVQT
jgi:hypothetical protein